VAGIQDYYTFPLTLSTYKKKLILKGANPSSYNNVELIFVKGLIKNYFVIYFSNENVHVSFLLLLSLSLSLPLSPALSLSSFVFFVVT
jgi:hypothetical protein